MNDEEPSPVAFAATALLFEAGLILVALFAGYLSGHSPIKHIFVGHDSEQPWLSGFAMGVVATLPMVIALFVMERSKWRPLADLRKLVVDDVIPLMQGLSIGQALAVSLLAGISEELLFRAWLQSWITELLGGDWGLVLAIALASLLFGICHWLSPAYLVVATLVSIYLGILYVATGNLVVPAVAHGLYDFIAILYLKRANGG